MKRDMDLCREILLCVEAREGPVGPAEVKIDGYTTDQIGYHAKLLADAGLLEGKSSTGDRGRTFIASSLDASLGRGMSFWTPHVTSVGGSKRRASCLSG